MSLWAVFFLGLICGYIGTVIAILVTGASREGALERRVDALEVDARQPEPDDLHEADWWKGGGGENPLGEPA